MAVRDINSGNILSDKKLYKNILIYDVSYKTFMGSVPMCIRLERVDEFIKTFDGIRY